MTKKAKTASIDFEFVKFLIDKNYTIREISQIVDVPYCNIFPRLEKKGIIPNKRDFYLVTPFQSELIIRKYKQGLPSTVIANDFGISSDSVIRLLKLRGIEIRESNDKIYTNPEFNHNAFTDMQDEESAYFYGLLLADGCITRGKGNGIALRLGLKREDEYMIQKFASYLKSNCKIFRENYVDKRTNKIYEASSIKVAEKNLINRLISLGFDFRKSTKEKLPPKEICNSRHFWRGMIDGDGSVSSVDRRTINLCGSLEVIEGFADFVKNVVGVNKESRIHNKSGLCNITYCGEYAIAIADFLYSDSKIHLKRKYESYLVMKSR